MRKNKIGLSTLILLTLLGSCGKTTEPSTQPSTNPSATPTPKPNTSDTTHQTQEKIQPLLTKSSILMTELSLR